VEQPSSISLFSSEHRKTLSAYVLAYLYWFASTCFAALVAYAARSAILVVILWAMMPSGKPSQSELFYINLEARALDSSLFLIYGAALILATVTFESMFRHWAFLEDVEERFYKVIVVMSLMITAFALVYLFVEFRLSGFTWRSLSEPLLSLLWSIFITWQWLAFHRAPQPSV